MERFVSGGSDGDGDNKENGGSKVSDGDSSSGDPCPDLRGAEKNECLIDAAMVLWDPSFCERIDERSARSTCYFGIVMDSGDPSFCERISDDFYKKGCYSGYFTEIASIDVNDCYSKYSNQNVREACIFHQVKKGDVRVCKSVQTEFDRLDCITEALRFCARIESEEECAIKAGIAVGNCDFIESPDLREICEVALLVGDDFVTE